jgi:hypothetical protein
MHTITNRLIRLSFRYVLNPYYAYSHRWLYDDATVTAVTETEMIEGTSSASRATSLVSVYVRRDGRRDDSDALVQAQRKTAAEQDDVVRQYQREDRQMTLLSQTQMTSQGARDMGTWQVFRPHIWEVLYLSPCETGGFRRNDD